MSRYLACIGDATDPGTWSGTPFHFLRAAQRHGFLDDGWAVHPERLWGQRLAWNLREWLRTGRRGGFQYSRGFLGRLLAQVPEAARHAEVITHFPLFPPVALVPGPVSFYIDLTLTQLFDDYGFGRLVSPRVQRDALARERDAYAAARHVVCMCGWTRDVVVSRYDVPAAQTHVIPGGANVDEAALASMSAVVERRALQPLRLGFVGKDFRRKNLAFLLEIADVLSARGFDTKVLALGFDPAQAPKHPRLRPLGFLDKRAALPQFVEFVRSLHFGCLFSHAEASPRANLEFIRLGVPALTWARGGMPDTVPDGLGHVFAGDASAEDVAEWLMPLVQDPDLYWALRDRVAARAHEVSWDHAVTRFQATWAPKPAPADPHA